MGDYLLRKGHTRAVFVGTSGNDLISRARGEGLREAFDTAGYPDGVLLTAVPHDQPVAPPTGGFGKVFVQADRVARRIMTRRHDRDSHRNRIEVETILAIDNAACRRRVREQLFPLLETLLAREATTAWVACSDSLAANCLDFLEWTGKRVPEDIAVVGFDDSPEAIYHQLTSYNFNGNAVMHAMVAHVVNPGAADGLAEPIRFGGYVVERGTA